MRGAARPDDSDDMSNQPRFTSDGGTYPRRSAERRPERGGRRRTFAIVALSVSGVLLAAVSSWALASWSPSAST